MNNRKELSFVLLGLSCLIFGVLYIVFLVHKFETMYRVGGHIINFIGAGLILYVAAKHINIHIYAIMVVITGLLFSLIGVFGNYSYRKKYLQDSHKNKAILVRLKLEHSNGGSKAVIVYLYGKDSIYQKLNVEETQKRGLRVGDTINIIHSKEKLDIFKPIW